MKKIFFVLAFMLLLCVTGSVFAQDDNGSLKDVSGATFGTDEVYVPEVQVVLNNMTFDENTRILTAQVMVKNTTDTFLGNLEYMIELMQGDKLVDNGMVFAQTKSIYNEKHNLGKLAPQESKQYEMMMTVPTNIDTANYFLRVFVNDKNLSFQNGDYTKYPFKLTGTGTRIGGVKMYLFAKSTDIKAAPTEGLSATPDEITKVFIPFSQNKEIQQIFTTSQPLTAKVQIFRTVKDQGLVKEFTTDFHQENVANEDAIAFDLLVDNDELHTGGAFNVHVSIINSDGEEIYARNLRWLIEYGQMMGRILTVDSHQNVYNKGESLNLVVTTSLFNAKDKKGKLNVTLKGRDGFEQKISKEVTFGDENEEKINFAEYGLNDNAHLTSISISLIDVKNNVVIDSYNTDINFDKEYGSGEKSHNMFLQFFKEHIYVIWIFASILFGLLAIVIYKITHKNNAMRVMLIILLGCGMLFLTSHIVHAACLCGGKPSGSMWIKNEPDKIICDNDFTVTVAFKVTCTSCINGIHTEITSSSGSQSFGDPGHVTSITEFYAITTHIVDKADIWANGYLTRNGCHCCAKTWNKVCKGGSGNGAVCPVYELMAQISKTYTCEAKKDGKCGSLNGHVYPYNAVGWGNGTFCNPNTSTQPQWPSFPAQGATTTWQCIGVNTGKTVSCSAKRQKPPAVNGQCSSGKIPHPIPFTQTAWSTTIPAHFCASGTPQPNPPIFPNYGQTVTWDCIGKNGGTSTQNGACKATRQMPAAKCGTAKGIETNTKPTANLCPPNHTASDPQIVNVNGHPDHWQWTCTHNVTGATPQSETCRAPIPGAECGSAHTDDPNNITNIKPTAGLCAKQGQLVCSWPGRTLPDVSLQNDGWWHWQCEHNPQAYPQKVDCHAPTCLVNMPIKYTNPVIISNNMRTTISLNCPGSNGNKLCCKIHNTTKGSIPEKTICTGDSGEIEIVEGENEFDAECWFDKNNSKTKDPNEPPVKKDFKVQTACIESQCTANGTCAKAPKIANSRSKCKSSCNSNADCTSGRIIETRP